jgi:hypothetical protein
MDRIGQLFVKELQNNVRSQTDINGSAYIPVKQTTAISRQLANNARRKKGVTIGGKTKNRKALKIGKVEAGKYAKVSGLDFNRLMFTGRFWQNAFKYTARRDDVKVYVNESYYSVASKNRVSYRDIVKWNNEGSPEVNRKILKPPLVFPKPEQVSKMKAFDLAARELQSPTTKKEIEQQIYRGAFKKLTINLYVG